MLRHVQSFAKYFAILFKKKKRSRYKEILVLPTKPLNGYLPHFTIKMPILNTESDHCECN